MTLTRRNILRSSALIPMAGLFGSINPITEAAAGEIKAVPLKDVLAMTPVQAAEGSSAVKAAMDVLYASAKKVQDAKTRAVIIEILDNPAPTIAKADQAKVTAALKEKNYIPADKKTVFPEFTSTDKPPQPFFSAPGSGYASHHAYPGGLATHTALNVLSAEDLLKNYRGVFDCDCSYDIAVGAEILYDLHKPWVFQWQPDNSSRVEQKCAGTGEHHILSIAESMKRGLDPRLVVAQACAHEHPGTAKSEASVVDWIDAAAIIAGVDPVKGKYLDASRKTLPLPRGMEGFIVHLADHDFVLSGPACQWSVAAMKDLAKEQYVIQNEKDFNAFRNFVFANLTAMRLYAILSSQGKEAFAKDIARAVRK